MNFFNFLESKNTKEAELLKLEKSLDSLIKTKRDLMLNKVDYLAIDHQITEIQNIIQRRKSGTNSWYGKVVRIDQDPDKWRIWGEDGELYLMPFNEKVMEIPVNWEYFTPFYKFLEYRREILGNYLTHTENRVIDVVPCKSNKEFCLSLTGEIRENPLNDATKLIYEAFGIYPLVIEEVGSIKKNEDTWSQVFVAILPLDIQGNWLKGTEDKITLKGLKKLPQILRKFGKT